MGSFALQSAPAAALTSPHAATQGLALALQYTFAAGEVDPGDTVVVDSSVPGTFDDDTWTMPAAPAPMPTEVKFVFTPTSVGPHRLTVTNTTKPKVLGTLDLDVSAPTAVITPPPAPTSTVIPGPAGSVTVTVNANPVFTVNVPPPVIINPSPTAAAAPTPAGGGASPSASFPIWGWILATLLALAILFGGIGGLYLATKPAAVVTPAAAAPTTFVVNVPSTLTPGVSTPVAAAPAATTTPTATPCAPATGGCGGPAGP